MLVLLNLEITLNSFYYHLLNACQAPGTIVGAGTTKADKKGLVVVGLVFL